MRGRATEPIVAGIREQVERLAAVIEAPPGYLPTFGRSDQSGRPHVEVTADGRQHWVVCERGSEFRRRTTLVRDELLYWIFCSITSSMASSYELAHRIEGEDFRRQMFAHQFELLARLNPRWRGRRIHELGRLVQDAGLDIE